MATEIDIAEEQATGLRAARSATSCITAGSGVFGRCIARRASPCRTQPPSNMDRRAWVESTEEPDSWRSGAEAHEHDPAAAAGLARQHPWRRLPEPDFWGPARSGPLDVSQHAIGAP